jgi:hypothetical protein
MAVFGHPIDERTGLAPRWWRLGLFCFEVIALAVICFALPRFSQ